MEQRLKFLDVFGENQDGALTLKKQIYLNGITFALGTIFPKDTTSGGVDFHLYKYWDIACKQRDDGSLEILGFYQQ